MKSLTAIGLALILGVDCGPASLIAGMPSRRPEVRDRSELVAVLAVASYHAPE
jgi:hypothetical protein